MNQVNTTYLILLNITAIVVIHFLCYLSVSMLTSKSFFYEKMKFISLNHILQRLTTFAIGLHQVKGKDKNFAYKIVKVSKFSFFSFLYLMYCTYFFSWTIKKTKPCFC